MFDLAADRSHHTKKYRPFAAGDLSVRAGIVAATLLVVATVGIALRLPALAAILLAVYLILTLSYSISLKHLPMVDVLVLAGLFTVRVALGGALLPTPISPWLLTFSMLFFFGLAVMKRYAELERVLRSDASGGRARGYSARDLPILLASGVACGISAVLIFTIYLISEQYPSHIYKNPGALWGITPIMLFWTLRAWHLSVHGMMNEDPLMFALKNRESLTLGFLVFVIMFIAWF
jgi:4-hydroxybenzoate polyprenyltransferase